jgi:hypothetical protein
MRSVRKGKRMSISIFMSTSTAMSTGMRTPRNVVTGLDKKAAWSTGKKTRKIGVTSTGMRAVWSMHKKMLKSANTVTTTKITMKKILRC